VRRAFHACRQVRDGLEVLIFTHQAVEDQLAQAFSRGIRTGARIKSRHTLFDEHGQLALTSATGTGREKQKAKGKGQKAKSKRAALASFTFCLLPFDFSTRLLISLAYFASS